MQDIVFVYSIITTASVALIAFTSLHLKLNGGFEN